MMKRSIDLFIPVVVKPKQSFRAGRSFGTRRFVGHADPKVKQNAQDLATFAAQHRPDSPLKGPLYAEFAFKFPWNKAERKQFCPPAGLAANPDIVTYAWKGGRGQVGDHDNLSKQLGDVLQRLGFFRNDAQLCHTVVRKLKGHEESGVHVTLRELE